MLCMPVHRRGFGVRRSRRAARRSADGSRPSQERRTDERGRFALLPRRQARAVQNPRTDHLQHGAAAAPGNRQDRPPSPESAVRQLTLDRRTVLIGGGAGVGLVVAFALWPRRLSTDLTTAKGEHAFGNYIKVARDGRITVAVPQVETGQGIWTALAQIVADELGAAWETIAVEPAPLTKAYANPLMDGDIRITANSTSVRAFEQPLREAAAVARTMLVGAAADRWNVSPSECDTADGFVINGGRTFTFGELAEEAAGRTPPRKPALRQSARSRLIGQPLQRLDGPPKADGSFRFAGDVRLPDMLFASARIAPRGGRLNGYSHEAMASAPGVQHVAARDGWIAIVADSWWAAERALKAANPIFSAHHAAA